MQSCDSTFRPILSVMGMLRQERKIDSLSVCLSRLTFRCRGNCCRRRKCRCPPMFSRVLLQISRLLVRTMRFAIYPDHAMAGRWTRSSRVHPLLPRHQFYPRRSNRTSTPKALSILRMNKSSRTLVVVSLAARSARSECIPSEFEHRSRGVPRFQSQSQRRVVSVPESPKWQRKDHMDWLSSFRSAEHTL